MKKALSHKEGREAPPARFGFLINNTNRYSWRKEKKLSYRVLLRLRVILIPSPLPILTTSSDKTKKKQTLGPLGSAPLAINQQLCSATQYTSNLKDAVTSFVVSIQRLYLFI